MLNFIDKKTFASVIPAIPSHSFDSEWRRYESEMEQYGEIGNVKF